MNIQQFYKLCLSKKGVTEHFPFDDDTLVFKVGGKIFVLTSLSNWELSKPSINVKCNPELAIELRETYNDVQPGFHMNKKHWNTVAINSEISDKIIFDFINHSYELVYATLSAKIRAELSNL